MRFFFDFFLFFICVYIRTIRFLLLFASDLRLNKTIVFIDIYIQRQTKLKDVPAELTPEKLNDLFPKYRVVRATHYSQKKKCCIMHSQMRVYMHVYVFCSQSPNRARQLPLPTRLQIALCNKIVLFFFSSGSLVAKNFVSCEMIFNGCQCHR